MRFRLPYRPRPATSKQTVPAPGKGLCSGNSHMPSAPCLKSAARFSPAPFSLTSTLAVTLKLFMPMPLWYSPKLSRWALTRPAGRARGRVTKGRSLRRAERIAVVPQDVGTGGLGLHDLAAHLDACDASDEGVAAPLGPRGANCATATTSCRAAGCRDRSGLVVALERNPIDQDVFIEAGDQRSEVP